MSNVKKRMDIYFDHRAPSVVVEIEEYGNGYKDIRKRGGKIRALLKLQKIILIWQILHMTNPLFAGKNNIRVFQN